MFQARWAYDGSAQGGKKAAFGGVWVVAAIVVRLTDAEPAAIAERYSWRWAIEPSNATGKQILGVGDAGNCTEKVVERTVPSGFLVQSLLICWYARCADDPADIGRRRRLCPWYRTKTTPSPADMLGRLRRDFLKTRFSAIQPGQDSNDQTDVDAWTCDSTAA